MILEVGREVDAVVFADVFDGVRGKFLGFGRDAHGVEDVTTGGEVTGEGSWADVGQASKLALADKAVFIVILNHKNYF